MSKSLTILLLFFPPTVDSDVNQTFTSFFLSFRFFQLEAKSPNYLDSDPAVPQGDVVADFPLAVVPVDILENIEGHVLMLYIYICRIFKELVRGSRRGGEQQQTSKNNSP